MPNVKDVADRAKVSTATVSRVLNKREWVAPATAERVREAIRALNYVPSALARGVRERKSGIIGVLMDTQNTSVFYDLFFTEIIRGVGCAIEPSGKHLLVYSGAPSHGASINVYAIASKLLDALIVGGFALRFERILEEALERSALNTVVIGRHLPNTKVSRVLIDNRGGGYKVGRQLLLREVRSVGVITPAIATYAFCERLEGLEAALSEASTPPSVLVQRVEGLDPECGYRGMKELLMRAPGIEALVITQTALTIGAIRYAQEARLSLPQKLLLVGDGPSCLIDFYPEPFALIHADARHVGKLAANLALEQLQGRDQICRELTVERHLYIPESWNRA